MSSADPAIDVHTHYVPHGWPELPGAEPAWLRVESEREAMIMVGSREFRRIQSDCWDPAVRRGGHGRRRHRPAGRLADPGVLRLRAQPRPTPPGSPAIFNDLALEICAGAPDRLVPFCQVPLQDTDAACAELDRCLAAGHAGVEIGNHVGDRDLDDAGHRDLPAALRRGRGAGVRPPVGPAHLAAAATVDGAVADRHARPRPTCRSWRWCSAGCSTGSTGRCASASPMAAGRSRCGWAGWTTPGTADRTSSPRPSSRRRTTSTGSRWIRWCSTRLRCGCSSRRWAPSQVMVGSDYPYPFGERPAGGVVRSARFLDDRRSDGDPDRERAALPGSRLKLVDTRHERSTCGRLLRSARSRTRRVGRRVLPARPVPHPAGRRRGLPRFGLPGRQLPGPAAKGDPRPAGRGAHRVAAVGVEGHTEAQAAVGELSRAAPRTCGDAWSARCPARSCR